MTAIAKGIDIFQSSGVILIRASLKQASGLQVTSGTINLRIFSPQVSGTTVSLQIYDWAATAFTAGTPTTDHELMTQQQYTNSSAAATNTGIWAYAFANTGFTSGQVYIIQVSDDTATPTAAPQQQEREFQFGSDQGDQVAQTGDNYGSPAGVITGKVAAAPTSGGSFSLTGLSPTLQTTANAYVGLWLVFTSGVNLGISRLITTLNGTTGAATFATSGTTGTGAFPNTPSANDTFMILAAGE